MKSRRKSTAAFEDWRWRFGRCRDRLRLNEPCLTKEIKSTPRLRQEGAADARRLPDFPLVAGEIGEFRQGYASRVGCKKAAGREFSLPLFSRTMGPAGIRPPRAGAFAAESAAPPPRERKASDRRHRLPSRASSELVRPRAGRPAPRAGSG